MLDSLLCTTSLQVIFGLCVGLTPSTSYSIHPFIVFFLQHVPIPNLFCCSNKIMSSNLNLSSLLGTLSLALTPHIHLIILISAHWSAPLFSFLTDQVSLPCSILLRSSHTTAVYSLALLINDISLLVSDGTNCLNVFYPIRILIFTAA